MPIDFEVPEHIQQQQQMVKYIADTTMRPFSRELDENEHARPKEYVEALWPLLSAQQGSSLKKIQAKLDAEQSGETTEKKKKDRPSTHYLGLMHMVEMLSWGDTGIYLCLPSAALGGSAIEAVGTSEQKIRLLKRFSEGEPVWGAMAMTEPNAGSDTSAIQTTAEFDEDAQEWILNGEKIFCTSGGLALEESEGLVIVWATIDRGAGRAGMKPFVVEAGTSGVKVVKEEIKHGIRASNTVAISFNDARIPTDNLLGSAEVKSKGGRGFKGAMATFDASRPLVAASALGIARASVEFVIEKLAEEGIDIPYGTPYHKLTAVQRDVMEMEADLKAAYLLTVRSISLLDQKISNPLEASMAKVKAGKETTRITQKAVEILGMMGYTREWLIEKWMRDGRINSIYEGTDQINTLIVARRILGYSRSELA
jgi:acyl-CoA dehydrogenase